jgi:hypothetical protein
MNSSDKLFSYIYEDGKTLYELFLKGQKVSSKLENKYLNLTLFFIHFFLFEIFILFCLR